MKIIERGQLPEDRVYRATCNHCKTQVEFTQGEAKYHSDWRDGDFVSVTCPLCSSLITASVGRFCASK